MAGLGHTFTCPSEMQGASEGIAREVRGEPESLIRHQKRGCEARGQESSHAPHSCYVFLSRCLPSLGRDSVRYVKSTF